MKLLLTSAGLANKSIVGTLNELVGLSKKDVHVVFIPTAANVEEGDKGWLINDLLNFKKQGYGCIDIVDISAVEREIWEPRLKTANVIAFGGGNTFHLMHWVKKSGLNNLLPELLKTSVYMGISAGSCITGSTIYNSVQNLFGETYELQIKDGLGIVDFQFIPHLNSPYFEKIREKDLKQAAKDMTESIYAADDNSAIKVVDGKIEVVSEGKYLTFNV